MIEIHIQMASGTKLSVALNVDATKFTQSTCFQSLRSTTTVNPGVVHGVCAAATWYIMHSTQYKILFKKLHRLLAMKKTHK